MPGIIVSDTSSLIILNKIGRLELLQSPFGQITITRIISEEFNNPLPDLLISKTPKILIIKRFLKVSWMKVKLALLHSLWKQRIAC